MPSALQFLLFTLAYLQALAIVTDPIQTLSELQDGFDEESKIFKTDGTFYHAYDVLSQGGYGLVYLASVIKNGNMNDSHPCFRSCADIAIKKIYIQKCQHFRCEDQLKHPYRCEIMALKRLGLLAGTPVVQNEDTVVYIPTELLPGVEWAQFLNDNPDFDNEKCSRLIMAAALNALGVLHSTGIVHGDVHMRNFLVKMDGEAFKVEWIDYGRAKMTDLPPTDACAATDLQSTSRELEKFRYYYESEIKYRYDEADLQVGGITF